MMQTTLGVEVIGVVRPGAIHAVAATRNGRVGLLATPATVQSGAYRDALHAAEPHVELTEVACPDLAQQVERGAFDESVLASVRSACAPLLDAGVDTVILGCTHYPLLRPMLQRTLGPDVAIISSGEPLARSVEHVLGARGLSATRGGEGDYRFLTTGDPAPFASAGTHFLQLPLTSVDQVTLSTPLEVVA
jgi:glutamate racemase